MTGLDRLLAAEAMVKAQDGKCRVCGTTLVACYQDFVTIGWAICDRCMRRWRRGTLSSSLPPAQKELP